MSQVQEPYLKASGTWERKKPLRLERPENKLLTRYAFTPADHIVKFATGGRSPSTGRHETGNSRDTRCTWLPCCRSSNRGVKDGLTNGATEMEEMD